MDFFSDLKKSAMSLIRFKPRDPFIPKREEEKGLFIVINGLPIPRNWRIMPIPKGLTLIIDCPPELCLLCLPIRRLLKFKTVNRNWRDIICGHHFYRNYYMRSEVLLTVSPIPPSTSLCLYNLPPLPAQQTGGRSILYTAAMTMPLPSEASKLRIANCCNGFVLLSTSKYNNPVIVSDPVSAQYLLLPQSQQHNSRYYVDCALGYCPNSEMYKVLLVFEESKRVKFQIHKVGTIGWNKPRLVPPSLTNNFSFKLGFPTYLDGGIHFILMQEEHSNFILRFDVQEEHFDLLPSPPLKDIVQRFAETHSSDRLTMGRLCQCLFVCTYEELNKIKIWVMKRQSWSLVLNISHLHLSAGLYRPVSSCDNKLFWMFNESRTSLHSYNEEEDSVRTFDFLGATDFILVDFEPSFASLKHTFKAYKSLKIHDISREGQYENSVQLYMKEDITHEFDQALVWQATTVPGDDLWLRHKQPLEQEMMFPMDM